MWMAYCLPSGCDEVFEEGMARVVDQLLSLDQLAPA